jgi:hypothetical protein
MAGTRKISVRLMFGNTIQETKAKHIVRTIDVSSDGKESIAEIKEKAAVSFTALHLGAANAEVLWIQAFLSRLPFCRIYNCCKYRIVV